MKTGHDVGARKRPVNLTLNEDLVQQVRGMTDNLSGVVEGLLVEYVERDRQERAGRAKAIAATIALWNDFGAKVGSFADEHSTL